MSQKQYKYKVSVIIPTYRPQEYLWECLNSLCLQTLPSTDYEIIIVLNGEQQPYMLQIEQFIACHSQNNIYLFYSNEKGVSIARNIGIDNAKGEYILFIDDDDYVTTNYIHAMLQYCSHDTVVRSNFIAFDNNSDNIPNYISSEYNRCASYGKQKPLRAKKFFSTPLFIIHRDIIANRRFNTNFQNGEDSLFIFLISNKIKYINFTPQDAIYYRRIRDNSASQQLKSLNKRINHAMRMMIEFTSITKGRFLPFYSEGYSFVFYITRLLASIHSIIQ